MDYTSEAEVRRKITKGAAARDRVAEATDGVYPPTQPDVVERFITQRIDAKRKAGLLMTDRQLEDYRHGRVLRVGDAVRYIGVDRREAVKVAGKDTKAHRPHGQEGMITECVKQGEAHVVTFRPALDALLKDEVLIELRVKEGTSGYLDLERVV